VVFYTFIIPYFNKIHLHPLIGTIIFESLFFVATWLLSAILIGKGKVNIGKFKLTKLKLAMALFAVYHIVDAVEPPFIMQASGLIDATNPTAIISWDWGIGYTIHQLFSSLSWQSIYYITNIGFIILLLLVLVLIYTAPMLKKIAKKALE
jgi:hypothetical protein